MGTQRIAEARWQRRSQVLPDGVSASAKVCLRPPTSREQLNANEPEPAVNLTAASYALHNPLEVVHFLDHFAQLNQLPQLSLGQMKAEPILEGAEEGAALEEPPFSRSSSSHL